MSGNMKQNSTWIAYYEAISISRDTSPTVFTDAELSEIKISRQYSILSD